MGGSLLTMMVAGLGLTAAQIPPVTAWTAEHGHTIRTHSATRNDVTFTDPTLKPTIGVRLPARVTTYPLPDTIKVPSADSYNYSIVNERPVVVERTTRMVIHTWD